MQGAGVAGRALVAPVSSANRLRDPARRGVFHLRAGRAERASAALLHVQINDWRLRAPVAVTPDELGEAWRSSVLDSEPLDAAFHLASIPGGRA
ncbi:hypothetical protein DBR42_18960 [Pelomonas sp. HMWF004]|nr:hypothetical protein DBR42_18960 [Pelomonas sp. HMWF004]